MADRIYDGEIWMTIPFAPDYAASTMGRFKRLTPCSRGRGHIVTGACEARGYVIVTLYVDGKKRSFRAHRVIATTFLGPAPPGKPEIAHADGRRDNNRLSNLRWADRFDNASDKVGHGTSAIGEGNSRAILTEGAVLAIRARYVRGKNTTALASEFGVSPQVVRKIIQRKIWAHL